jgi:hypothetical protein
MTRVASGTDVMILKIFSPKMASFTQNTESFAKFGF